MNLSLSSEPPACAARVGADRVAVPAARCAESSRHRESGLRFNATGMTGAAAEYRATAPAPSVRSSKRPAWLPECWGRTTASAAERHVINQLIGVGGITPPVLEALVHTTAGSGPTEEEQRRYAPAGRRPRGRRGGGLLAEARVHDHPPALEQERLGPAQALGVGPLGLRRRVDAASKAAEAGLSPGSPASSLRTTSERITVKPARSARPRASVDLPVPGSPPTSTRHGRRPGASSSPRASSQCARALAQGRGPLGLRDLRLRRARSPPPCPARPPGRRCRTAAAPGPPRRPRPGSTRRRTPGPGRGRPRKRRSMTRKAMSATGSAKRNRSLNSMQSMMTRSAGRRAVGEEVDVVEAQVAVRVARHAPARRGFDQRPEAGQGRFGQAPAAARTRPG